MFMHMIREANLTHLLANVTNSYTVLVPSDAVFEELREMYDNLLQNPHQLAQFVKLHILDGILNYYILFL